MKLKPSDVSTVIIVNKNKEGSQTLQVKTKHINRLKHYLFAVLAVITTLTLSVIYLNHKSGQQEEERLRLVAQLVKLKGEIPPPNIEVKKTNTAQSYIQSIEVKLQTINNYLRKRGLKGFSTAAVGGNGNAEAAKLTDSETYSLYDEYLNRLVHTVAFTPMGYPRVSSLTSYFGYRSDPFNSASAEFHPGIDFKGNRGDEAKCTATGKVVFAGWYGGYGNCVRIAHANSFETLYGHLSKISVRVGQEVTVGQKIGEVGSTGHSTGTHLHYEVRKNGKAINPIKFLTLNN
ncbi:M23 family metallopeptidase [Mucilaginibacter sp. BJC16-A38]|uniref:M23 family metallopeptidase n=1 Tax=Mucilaginibacter phenanthrenivorans TaxID=1234842 RepID=UPI0021580E2C|nr:M23 family metallopeptidase [Mucilaginibacter phenanthrenivorans]MCR8558755.1 M23 family metallopeptidase [Mucilaginibacter phenanthrenivorans]